MLWQAVYYLITHTFCPTTLPCCGVSFNQEQGWQEEQRMQHSQEWGEVINTDVLCWEHLAHVKCLLFLQEPPRVLSQGSRTLPLHCCFLSALLSLSGSRFPSCLIKAGFTIASGISRNRDGPLGNPHVDSCVLHVTAGCSFFGADQGGNSSRL